MVALCGLVVGGACRTSQPAMKHAAPVPVGWESSVVPLVAPDSEPQWLYDDSSWTHDARWPGTPFMRDIVLMRIAVDASQAERQAIVDAVHGTVVGGSRFTVDPPDGLYLVRTPRGREVTDKSYTHLKKIPAIKNNKLF